MSILSRIVNVFRNERLNRGIDEELESHIEEAIDRGRDPQEVWRAFGSILQHRDESRDFGLNNRLESLRADCVFGWRRLAKTKITTAAAILSLALAIGACVSSFRLIDALLLHPLPVAHPEQLYVVSFSGISPTGNVNTWDTCTYPMFQQWRAAVSRHAELIAISNAAKTDLTFGSDFDMEKAYRQYVSGWMFDSFGLKPALGRLFTEFDDKVPLGSPYAVLSYDYWSQRFGQDPHVIGRTFRIGKTTYEIVGVSPRDFVGTEPGKIVDIFVPTMMNRSVTALSDSWFRTFVRLKPDTAQEIVRQQLYLIFHAMEQERSKGFVGMTQKQIDNYVNHTGVSLEPAAVGVSRMQTDYRRALITLGVLVALVLLIACSNVANLIVAQSEARRREMALRVAIGAGRARLVQLVLVESAILATLAAALGAIFAWWSAPIILGMTNPPDNPARLVLPADWRVLGFGMGLALLVTCLLGLAPALRASAVNPANALKGGEIPRSQRRSMYMLIAAQTAFCFLLMFGARLFVSTFQRLTSQPTGFSPERLITFDTVSRSPQLPAAWEQVTNRLREMPGVQSASLSEWSLLSGNGWNNFIWLNGSSSEVLADFLPVSSGWIETMGIPLLEGRDIRPNDAQPGAAVVDRAFVEQILGGKNAIGITFEIETLGSARLSFHIVGVVGDARYRNLRDPMKPLAYVSFHRTGPDGALLPRSFETFVVRTANANPLELASALRQQISQVSPDLRVSNIRTQQEIDEQYTIRERLLAALAAFFAGVALLLAGIGVYGVLHYLVLRRSRELGIRIAIGARPWDIARTVISGTFLALTCGAAAGITIGLLSVRYVEGLLFEVKGTDLQILVLPSVIVLAAPLLAALPAVVRAIRVDPLSILRAE